MSFVPSWSLTLFDLALDAVMKNFSRYESDIKYLPPNVKSQVLHRMLKRGLLSDRNATSVLHDGVMDINLSDCSVSQQSLRNIALLCPRLIKLDLSVHQGCRNYLNSNDISFVFTHCKRLQLLKLKGCVLLDNKAITVLAANCPYLVSLCVSGCHMVSDKGIIALSLKCHYLQALDLTRTKVSTEGLVSLSSGRCAAKLKEVKVSHCINVTDKGVQTLLESCPRLSILILHGCPMLTSTSRDAAQSLSSLKQLTWTIY